MSRAELLAKLSPHGVAISGAGFGGMPELTAMDVAGALGMGRLSRPAYLFGLLKYAGDQGVAGSVWRLAFAEVVRLAKAEGWEADAFTLTGLTGLAILENLEVPVCDRCNGSGTVAAKVCDKCSGCGRVPRSNRKRAALVGVSETSWRREWKPRAAAAYAIVQAWDADVQAHVARQFMRAIAKRKEKTA